LTSPDWTALEEALVVQLPARRPGTARAALLADLGRYTRAVVQAAHAQGPAPPSRDDIEAAHDWLMRPVFICGHHRSGTTLLQELLDGHPDLMVLPSEGTYFSSFRSVARRAPAQAELDRFATEWVARFVDPNYEPHFKLGRSSGSDNPYVRFARRWSGWLTAIKHDCPQVAEFAPLLALAAAYRDVQAGDSAPRMWIDKTPLNERYLRRFDAFADARFIQLVRDPQDSLASLLEALRAAGVTAPDVAAHASDIGHSLRLAAEYTRRFPQRYIAVKYEDLVDSTAIEMERVCRFLEIEPHGSLRTPTRAGVPARSNSSFGRDAAGAVRRSGRGTQLSPHDARVLSASAAVPARAFGYDLPWVSAWFRSVVGLRNAPRALKRRLRSALR